MPLKSRDGGNEAQASILCPCLAVQHARTEHILIGLLQCMAFTHPRKITGIGVHADGIIPPHAFPRALTAVCTRARLFPLARCKLGLSGVVVPGMWRLSQEGCGMFQGEGGEKDENHFAGNRFIFFAGSRVILTERKEQNQTL
eukprot:scaffold63165_cov14-Tisochrysis_lutea.AAC.1